MRVGDLIRIKPEHQQEEDFWSDKQTYPPDSKWIGLVTHVFDEEYIEVMWGWSGNTLREQTVHLEVICK